MHVLSVIHGEKVRAGVFGEAVEARGHVVEEWSLAWGTPLPRPLDAYGAVLVFGGAMHADQDAASPVAARRELLPGAAARPAHARARHLPRCAAARQGGACGGRARREPEIGWFPVELTEAPPTIRCSAACRERFDAFQWHYYAHGVPAGAVELARNDVCTQAFRLGDTALGRPVPSRGDVEQIESWIQEDEPIPDPKPARPRRASASASGTSSASGLCAAFVRVAERVAIPA